MPSDDVILALKQIAGYPSAPSVQQGDSVVVQRGGLGGPYLSMSAQAFVGSALAQGGNMAINGAFSANSIQGGSGQFANLATGYLNAQKASVAEFNATAGTIGCVPIATTDYVDGLRAASVTSFNGRVGDVQLWTQDIVNAGGAPIWSPVFSGEPRAPTPYPTSCNSQIATTKFVQRLFIDQFDHMLADHPFVFSFNGRSGDIVLTEADVEGAVGGSFAPIDSPVFTGDPQAPTPAPGDSSGSLATTQFVTSGLSSAITGLATVYAPLDSPAFFGTPTGLTAAPGTSTGQLATTAFVMNAVAESTAGVASFNGRTGVVTLAGPDIAGAGGALLDSPAFTGIPTGPTAGPNANTAQLATCAWVLQEIGGATIGVMSFNGRGGAVVLNTSDITGAGGAPLVSAQLSGVPTAPTAASNTSTDQIATTAFVMDAITTGAGVTSFNGRTGAVTLNFTDISAAGGLANPSPALTGVPTAPTASAATSTTQIATTAFVYAAMAAGAVVTFNGRTGAVTLTAADISNAGGALLASPLFTGNPQAPTPSTGDASGAIATTLFVTQAIANVGANYLPLSGGTLTGPLSVSAVNPQIILNKTGPVAGNWAYLTGTVAGSVRWAMILGDSTAEGGSNSGSNFSLTRFSDTGASLGSVLSITRSSGAASFGGPLAISGNLTGVNNISGNSASFTGSCNAGPSTIGQVVLSGNVVTANTVSSTAFTMAAGGNFTTGSSGSVNLNNTTSLAVGGVCNLGANATTNVVINPGTGGYPGSNNGSSWGIAGQAWFQVNSYSFPNASDRKLKTKIERGLRGVSGPAPRIVSGGAAIPYVEAIPVYTFQWKEPSSLERRFQGQPLTHVGFIADEVQAAFGPQSDIVTSDDEGENLAVSVNQMLAVLWQAVRELSEQMTTLKARLA